MFQEGDIIVKDTSKSYRIKQLHALDIFKLSIEKI